MSAQHADRGAVGEIAPAFWHVLFGAENAAEFTVGSLFGVGEGFDGNFLDAPFAQQGFDPFLKFDHSLVKPAGAGEHFGVGEFTAVVADDGALAGFNDIEKGDVFGIPGE